ncbi:MAG: MFS transporter [Anaerolineae bacterium]|nr:MFS transporter [Anaerolineae bacterium]
MDRELPPNYRRNFAALLGDFFFFGVAMSFINPTTVMPSLVRQLTSSAPLIGLVTTILSGGWMLPQLIAANYVAGKPLKKPYVVFPALTGRLGYLLLTVAIWLWAVPHPNLVLVLFFLVLTLFIMTDGIASVAWFDVFSKSLPPARRGRLVGLAQTGTGMAGVGAGIIVSHILGPNGPDFPINYALLFAIASGFFSLSLLSFIRVKEQPLEIVQDRLPWPSYISRLIEVMRADHMFRLVVLVRLLVMWSNMAIPFYVIYALDVLRFDQGVVGIFLSAQVIGGILSGLVMGYISERQGTRMVICLTAGMAVGAPTLALCISWLRTWLPGGVLMYVYALVFTLLGALANANMAGFMNYILEIAPAAERSTYVGLANTLGSVVLIAPFLGGWVLQISSYTVLLSLTAIVCLAGLFSAARLEEPRQRRMALMQVQEARP